MRTLFEEGTAVQRLSFPRWGEAAGSVPVWVTLVLPWALVVLPWALLAGCAEEPHEGTATGDRRTAAIEQAQAAAAIDSTHDPVRNSASAVPEPPGSNAEPQAASAAPPVHAASAAPPVHAASAATVPRDRTSPGLASGHPASQATGDAARPTSGAREDAPAPPALSLPRLPAPAQRTPAPDLTLTDLGGKQIRLRDLRGRAVLVTFWATWCGPCKQEIPQLVRWQETYAGRGLTILGVSLDQQGLPVVRTFVRERPEIRYTIIPNGARAAEAFGGVERIPTAFLLDKRGRVVARFQGLPRGTEVEGFIQAVLRES